MTYGQVYLGLSLKRNRVHHDGEAWCQDQIADNCISITSMDYRERESEPEVRQGYIFSKPAPGDLVPPARLHFLSFWKQPPTGG